MSFRRSIARRYNFGILTTVAKNIFHSSYHAGLLSGVFKRAFEKRCDLKIIPYDAARHTDLPAILHEHSLDGLIVVTWRWIHPRFCALIENARDERVLVVNDPLPGLGVNIVHTDVAAGIRQAVDHLARKKVRKIGMLRGPAKVSFRVNGKVVKLPFVDTELKSDGFLRACKGKGIAVKKNRVRSARTNSEAEGYRIMKAWIREKDLPRAVICGNDDLAFGAVKAVKEKGLDCPKDIAVVGFDDNNRARIHVPPLTTIRQPLGKMGEDAVNILLRQIRHPGSGPVSKKYPPRLIVRKSA